MGGRRVRTRCGIPRPGVTLVEVVVSSLLVATLMLTCLHASWVVHRNAESVNHSATAGWLMDAVLEEVASRVVVDRDLAAFDPSLIGPDAGETRTTFDDVDDYDGWDVTSPTDAWNAPIADADGWRVRLSVVPWALSAGGTTFLGADTPARMLMCRLNDPTGREYVGRRLVAVTADDVRPESETDLVRINLETDGVTRHRWVAADNRPEVIP